MDPLHGFIVRALHASDIKEGIKEEKERKAGVALYT